MRRPRRPGSTVRRFSAGLLACALLAGACTSEEPGIVSVESERLTIAEPAFALEVDAGLGGVELRPHDGDALEVNATLRFRGRRPEVRQTVDGSTVRLSSSCSASDPDCSVSFVIDVPASIVEVRIASISGEVVVGALLADVDVITDAGDVRAEGLVGGLFATSASGGVSAVSVAGRVEARTDSGDVFLSELDGELDVHTASGAVEGSTLRVPRATVRTDSGPVQLSFSTPPVAVSVTTSSGDVLVVVPGLAYRILAETTSGRVVVDVVEDGDAHREISVRTVSGDIAIEPGGR